MTLDAHAPFAIWTSLCEKSRSHIAEWMQCPSCKMIWHTAYIKRCVQASKDTFVCPICREPYDIEYMMSDPNAWSAVELQQRLRSDREDDEYMGAGQPVGSSDGRLRSTGPVKKTL